MIRKLCTGIAGVVCVLALSAPAVAAGLAPDALVKSTMEEVLRVIKQNRDRRALVDIAEKKVLPHFDFATMTRLAVGKWWREATPDQRKALEDAFRTLLVNTYTTALSEQNAASPSFEVKPVQLAPGQDDVTVHSIVKPPDGQQVAIDYRMELTAGGWKVYDVIVENLSLVTNYRSTFASEISRSGIDGLIKALQAKNKQIGAS